MPEIKTIVDDNGDVWTGKVTGTDDHLARDIIGSILFPLTLLVPSDPPTVTVEVNGQSHSGIEHKELEEITRATVKRVESELSTIEHRVEKLKLRHGL